MRIRAAAVLHVIIVVALAILSNCVGAASPSAPAIDSTKPVKVFILAGQSNMEGKAKVQLLEYQIAQPATRRFFEHLQNDGKWIERQDVWIKFLDRKGNLTVGFGSPNCIGPELEFGNVVGDHYVQQVLLIKTAWGGKSLYRDFRSPGAGFPDAAVLEQMLAAQKAKKPQTTLDGIKATFGASYRAMLEEVKSTLADLKRHFPQYRNQGYELAGFVWFQGWNDMIDDRSTGEYAANLGHFIRDVRKDLAAPDLPFVVAQMGVNGVRNTDAKIERFKQAQAAGVAGAELKGNVALVKTDVFWDLEADAVFKKGWRQNLEEWNKVGSDYPYHYLGSPKTLCQIGKALGETMLQLCPDAKQPGAR